MKTIKQPTLDSRHHPRSGRTIAVLAFAVVGLGWLLAGCVPTAVHPLYRTADVLYDPALLGVWKDKPDGKERWTISSGEGKGYTLEIQNEDQQAVFVAHLFRLGNDRFLDLYPVKSALEARLQNNPYGAALVPTHLFVRVQTTDPRLRMSCMGLDWLKERLQGDPKALAHVLLSDGRVVITDGTEAMQGFIKRHINETAAWNEMYGDGLAKFARESGSK